MDGYLSQAAPETTAALRAKPYQYRLHIKHSVQDGHAEGWLEVGYDEPLVLGESDPRLARALGHFSRQCAAGSGLTPDRVELVGATPLSTAAIQAAQAPSAPSTPTVPPPAAPDTKGSDMTDTEKADQVAQAAQLVDQGRIAEAQQAIAELSQVDRQAAQALAPVLAERQAEVSELAEIERGLERQELALTNLDVTIDALGPLRAQMVAKVNQLADQAGDKAPAETRAALDAGRSMIARIDRVINVVSGLVGEAREQNKKAHAGLEPVRQAQANLQRAGATVEILLDTL